MSNYLEIVNPDGLIGYTKEIVKDQRFVECLLDTRSKEIGLRVAEGETIRFLIDTVMGRSYQRSKTLKFATTNVGKIQEFENFIDVMAPEVKEIFHQVFDVNVCSAAETDAAHEDGKTFQENSIIKSWSASRHPLNMSSGNLILAEDSGLSLDNPELLVGPGVYSARLARMKYDLMNEGKYWYHKVPGLEIEIIDLLDSYAAEDTPSSKQKIRDLMNNVVLMKEILLHDARLNFRGQHGGDSSFVCVPAYYEIYATVAKSGRIVHGSMSRMHGLVVVSKDYDFTNPENLDHLASDFGYNPIFLAYDDGYKLRRLSSIPKEERLRWNHRSRALTSVVLNTMASEVGTAS